MRKSISITLLVLIVVLGAFGIVSAQGPDEPDRDKNQAPWCSDMPDAQVPGKKPGSACRVPIVPASMSFDTISKPPRSLYRSGWTHQFTSESDSDLVEDTIKVEAFLYWGTQLDDQCDDENHWSSHAACRTYGQSADHQYGYHYFHKTGYPDQDFWTSDYW